MCAHISGGSDYNLRWHSSGAYFIDLFFKIRVLTGLQLKNQTRLWASESGGLPVTISMCLKDQVSVTGVGG